MVQILARKGNFLCCFDDCDFVRWHGIRSAILYRLRIARGEGVQDGLHTVRDAELVVDTEEVIFNGVLAQFEHRCQLGVAETVG